MSIVKFSDVDLKKISYTNPEKQGQYYYSAISYGPKDPLHIQTPRMICKSNGSECVLKKTPTIEIESLTLDFLFYDFILSLDERNIQETFRNNESWFGKDIPLEVIDDMYKRTTKPNKENSKPKFIFKIPVVKNSAQCPIYDQKKICQTIDKITKDCEVILILHIRGLKFLKQHYYCDCYVSQMKVFLPSEEKYSVIQNYVIEDDENSEPLELKDSIIEKAELEKAELEKEELEKAELGKAEQEKADQEKADQEKADQEKAAQEKADQEKAAQEKTDQVKEQLKKKELLRKEFEKKQKFLEAQVLEMEKMKRELDNL